MSGTWADPREVALKALEALPKAREAGRMPV